MNIALVNLIYLIASIFFILGLKGLAHPKTAVKGNLLGAVGMLIAIVVTLFDKNIISFDCFCGQFPGIDIDLLALVFDSK